MDVICYKLAEIHKDVQKNSKDIIKIVRRSYSWFVRNGFKNPILYVPPGWALERLQKKNYINLILLILNAQQGWSINKNIVFTTSWF